MASTLSATKFTAPFVCAWLVALLAVPVCADLKWKLELPGEVEWSKVVWTGSLLVGAKDHITLISPDGSLMWSRTDLKNLAPFNVQSVPGSDAIVVSELVSKIPMRARLSVLNLATGETRWKTDPTMGSNLGGYPIPERDLVLFARDMQGGQGVKAGANLSAFNLNSGEVLWTQRLGSMGSLPSHVSDSGGFIPTTDLSGHPPPVIQGDLFIWQAGDLFAVDLTSGELRWRYKLKAKNPQLKNAFARPIV
ncbi:MAG: PQQ-binding-like beta-propeller repeat protein, partial [Gammaproteobacteria bacterium]|nr:PQQ-binding-like beta-propeller repeat protein [Gammaproteobacteria bacterium]